MGADEDSNRNANDLLRFHSLGKSKPIQCEPCELRPNVLLRSLYLKGYGSEGK